MKPFIYALVDPLALGHVRYVGMAMKANRPYQHAKNARTSLKHSHLFHWIRLLQAKGQEPTVLVLEELPETTSRTFVGLIERMYIDSLRRIGHQLTNVAEGGFGGYSGPHSEETRAKISATMTGRKQTDEHRARAGAASAARVRTPEWRAKISATLKGRPISAEQHIQRFGRVSPCGFQGGVHSAETRAKMTTSQIARWAKRKADAECSQGIEDSNSPCVPSPTGSKQEV